MMCRSSLLRSPKSRSALCAPSASSQSTPSYAETSDWSSVLDGVGHHHDGLELVVLGEALGHQRCVGTLVDQRHHVGVVEEVVELALDVAVVDVDVDRADLHHRQHGDDVLDAVLGVDADVVAGAYASRREEVGEPVGVGLELGVGHRAVSHLHGGVVRDGVDGVLEEVGDVQGHGPRLEHVLVFR